jgi:hypothetical protein
MSGQLSLFSEKSPAPVLYSKGLPGVTVVQEYVLNFPAQIWPSQRDALYQTFPPDVGTEEESVKRFFRRLTPAARADWRANYETKLSIINGTYQPGKDLFGKARSYPEKFEWMKSSWESGLKLLNEVMKELNELP